MFIVD